MLAFAGLRVEGEGAQVLVVSQPPPLAFLVLLLSDQAGALERQKKHQEDIFISKLGFNSAIVSICKHQAFIFGVTP